MPVALILIGAILVVVAFRNTFGDLFKELQADIPGFFVWVVAIAAILGLGYVPGLKTPSRLLLGLVAVVLLLTNYKQLIAGFQNFASSGGQPVGQPAPNPASAGFNVPSPASVAGTASGAAQAGAGGIAGALAGPGLGALGGLASSAASAADASGSIMNLAGGGFGSAGIDPSSYIGIAEMGAMFL